MVGKKIKYEDFIIFFNKTDSLEQFIDKDLLCDEIVSSNKYILCKQCNKCNQCKEFEQIDIYDDDYNKEREENISKLHNTDYIIKIIHSKRRKLPKCNGCYPVFQCNQLGHMGYNGCLEDDDMCYFEK